MALKKLYLLAPPVHHYPFNELAADSTNPSSFKGDADEVVLTAQVFDWAAKQQLPIINFEDVVIFSWTFSRITSIFIGKLICLTRLNF